MKLLFLDIDGVLNSSVSIQKIDSRHRYLPDPALVANLDYICARTGAKIVVSSTWRMRYSTWAMDSLLYLCGARFCEVIGDTPVLDGQTRGEEIRQYIEQAEFAVTNIVILDDLNLVGELDRYLVQTNPDVGLTLEDAHRAIALLGQQFNFNY